MRLSCVECWEINLSAAVFENKRGGAFMSKTIFIQTNCKSLMYVFMYVWLYVCMYVFIVGPSCILNPGELLFGTEEEDWRRLKSVFLFPGQSERNCSRPKSSFYTNRVLTDALLSLISIWRLWGIVDLLISLSQLPLLRSVLNNGIRPAES